MQYNENKINIALVTITDEDHTLGNVVRYSLLKDKSVKFAGYRKPHPLENKIEIKCQTNGMKRPSMAIQDACQEVINHIDSLETSFRDAVMRYKQEGVVGSTANPEYAKMPY